MIEKVIKVYEALNTILNLDMPVNNVDTRDRVKAHLEDELPNCIIKCDEENNQPILIDECVAIARVQWLSKAMEITYVDLIFGTPEQINKVQLELN